MMMQSKTHAAFEIVNPEGTGPFVITCDHASNHVPPELGNLGLQPADLKRHIAIDIGAAAVARLLSARFESPAILCGTSRLVIDCNRHPHDPTAMPEVSDHTPIPGNRGLGPVARQDRVDRFFRPYHDAIEAVIERRLAAGRQPAILSIHSMTPEMNGRFRPWQIALSAHADRRLTDVMLAALRRRTDVVIGDNEPYNMDPAEDYSTPAHAISRNLPHLQVEFRQDEVGDAAGVARFAAIFGDALAEVLKDKAV